MELIAIITVWILLCLGVAGLANSRGRSGLGFFLLSFFFSPLLGLIVALVGKNLAEEAAKEHLWRWEEERKDMERKREHEKQLESLRAVTANQVRQPPVQVPEPSVSHSLADELTKLAALKEKGILTLDEFEQQKKLLLARTSA